MNILHHSTVFKKPYESFTTSCPQLTQMFQFNIFRILEPLPLPQIQGLHLLILNVLIIIMVSGRQLIYLLIHLRYAY